MKRVSIVIFFIAVGLLGDSIVAQELPVEEDYLEIPARAIVDAPPQWSPDSSQLITRYERVGASGGIYERLRLHIWNIEQKTFIEEIEGFFDTSIPIAWDPGGDVLVSWNKQSTQVAARVKDSIQIWDANSQEPFCVLPIDDAWWPAWNHDGSLLTTVSRSINHDSWLDLWDVQSCQKHLDFEDQKLFDVSWHPDENIFIAQNLNRSYDLGSVTVFQIFNAETGELLIEIIYPLAGGPSLQPLWSPDGKYLLSTYGSTLKLWSVAAGEVSELSIPLLSALAMDWHPNSNWIAFIDGFDGMTVHIWDVSAQALIYSKTYSDPEQNIYLDYVNWSPDGKWLALATNRGSIYVWKWDR